MAYLTSKDKDEIARFKATDISSNNIKGIVYIRGNANTDDSVRLVPSVNGPHESAIEVRRQGIFQPAGLDLGPLSLSLGLDVAIEAHGSSLNISSVESGTKELTVAAEFNDNGSKPAKVIVLDPRLNRVIVNSDTSDELVTVFFTDSFVGITNAFRYKFYFKTGSIAATSIVTLTIQKGSAGEGGEVFFIRKMPASDWPANIEVEVELDGGLNITPGNSFTLLLSSDNNFSLLGKDFGSFFLNFFAFDIQPYGLQTLVSIPDGTDRFLGSIVADSIYNNLGNRVLQGSQVSVNE